jgi:hypothetical protein
MSRGRLHTVCTVGVGRIRAHARAAVEVLALGAKKKCHTSTDGPTSKRLSTRACATSAGEKRPASR